MDDGGGGAGGPQNVGLLFMAAAFGLATLLLLVGLLAYAAMR
jgi:hypothetical protein